MTTNTNATLKNKPNENNNTNDLDNTNNINKMFNLVNLMTLINNSYNPDSTNNSKVLGKGDLVRFSRPNTRGIAQFSDSLNQMS